MNKPYRPRAGARIETNAKTYDSLRIVVKKGRKADIQAHAEKQGESINAFVGRAIEETMARDTEGGSKQ